VIACRDVEQQRFGALLGSGREEMRRSETTSRPPVTSAMASLSPGSVISRCASMVSAVPVLQPARAPRSMGRARSVTRGLAATASAITL